MLVIADLLGVPESDHEMFRAELAARRPGAVVGRSGEVDGAQSARMALRAVHRVRRRRGVASPATT